MCTGNIPNNSRHHFEFLKLVFYFLLVISIIAVAIESIQRNIVCLNKRLEHIADRKISAPKTQYQFDNMEIFRFHELVILVGRPNHLEFRVSNVINYVYWK